MRCCSLPPILILLLTTAWPGSATSADTPRVVVSIAPLHSLVARVMRGVGEPELLVPPGQSPHLFALAPSDARALSHADLVVTNGGEVDRFLQRALAALAADTPSIRLLQVDAIRHLPARAGGAWPSGHAQETPSGHGDRIDPHAWLDPRNARAFTQAVARELAKLDPAHGERYRANADALAEQLTTLDRTLARQLAPVAERPYLVFHDAYQYFEHRYALAPAGSVVVDPGRPPGAARLSRLRERIRARDIACLFVEPQFEPRIARAIAEGTGIQIAELDPLGAGLTPGPALYPELLKRLANSLRRCL